MSKKILVVDDEADLRNLVQTCLEIMGGWQVTTASSGTEALQQAQDRHLRAILLDLMLPDMDGLAILQELRSHEKTRHIPIILLTAKGKTVEITHLSQFEVKGVIKKPFNPMKLADQVDFLLKETDKK